MTVVDRIGGLCSEVFVSSDYAVFQNRIYEKLQMIKSLTRAACILNQLVSKWNVKRQRNESPVNNGPISKQGPKSILFTEKLLVLSKVFSDISLDAFDLLKTFLNDF